jgi:sporulation protein YlmC with PRC-barrel domain
MFRKDEVAGKVVVEASGKSLGKAKDIAFSLDGTVVLIVSANDNSEVEIPMDRIAGVAEYIVVRRPQQNEPGGPAPKKAAAPAPAANPPMAAMSPPPAPRPNPAIPPAAAPVPVAVSSSVCKNCGAPLRAGAKFCTKCGAPA